VIHYVATIFCLIFNKYEVLSTVICAYHVINLKHVQ